MEDNSLSAVPHIASQQEKLDALFGITNGKDLGSFLDEMTLADAEQKKEDTLSAIEQLSSLQNDIESQMQEIEAMPTSMSLPLNELSIQMSSMDHSLKQLEEMVDLSKDVIRHVHASILATPLIDSEAVQAYSKLVESIHISISEFINVYRDKQNFVNKVKYAIFDQQQKKELIRYKADQQIRVMQAKEGPKTVDADAIGTNVDWNSDKVSKMIDAKFAEENSDATA